MLLAALVLSLGTAGLAPSAAAPAAEPVPGNPLRGTGASAPKAHETVAAHRSDVDARAVSVRAEQRAQTRLLRQRSESVADVETELGVQGVFKLDPLTGTPANVVRVDGSLTGPSDAAPVATALGYVRSHLDAFGLTTADVAALDLRSAVTDVHGVTHLTWSQRAAGIPVFGNGLRAHVASDGSLIAIQGAPVSNVAELAADAPDARLRAAAAGAKGNSDAEQVWFLTRDGLRPAWSTYSTAESRQSVVDAVSGRVLYQRSTVDRERGDALVFPHRPAAPRGGTQRTVNFVDRGWIGRGAAWLRGSNVLAWADVDDDGTADPNEKTPLPGTRDGAQFRFRPQNASPLCAETLPCSWDPDTPFSWRVNKNQDVTQAFHLANVFHDYLERAPIGFTAQMGNFETNGGDPLLLQALNGAAVDAGLPDAAHVAGPSMSTPPDSIPPTMQLNLYHQPHTTRNVDPHLPTSASDAADEVFHEYAHGLSNRLVVDASGNSTLTSLHARAMGEGWSDYFALDYLVTKGLIADRAKAGQVLFGRYVGRNLPIDRREAIDCGVASRANLCVKFDGTPGGYTFGDLGQATGGPEEHADGEIWAQTLWDLRAALGHRVAAAIVTEAMSLSVADPSFLDQRDAVISADHAIYEGQHVPAIWRVFAGRGMGFLASTSSGADADVIEDFSLPPSPETPRATLAGVVTDDATEEPLPGTLVFVGGHFTRWRTVTDEQGRYQLDNVVAANYPEVVASRSGYDLASAEASVSAPETTLDFVMRRDWASLSGGGSIDSFTGPDAGAGCGPEDAIDQTNSEGWTTDVADGQPSSTVQPKYIVIRLPEPVDITSFAIDPSATCGDGTTAAMSAYTIEVSLDGKEFSPVERGTFERDDLGTLNAIPADRPLPGVQFVKVWVEDNMLPAGVDCSGIAAFQFSGCRFMDLTEVAVYGRAGEPVSTDLQVLSFNDFHGHLEATDPPLSEDLDPSQTPVGGVEYLSTAIKNLRADQPETTLTVAAGDLIGGSTFLSGIFADEPSIAALEELGLDVSSVGNHEFDEGTEELKRIVSGGCRPVGCFEDENGDDIQYDGADFDYLAANVVGKLGGAPLLPPTSVRMVDGIPVGFIGMTLEATPTLVNPAGVTSVDFLDEVETANRQAAALKAAGVESIIVLLHEGGLQSGTYDECDGPSGAIVEIAEQMTPEVDMLVTGHTHQPYVCAIDDPNGNPRLVTSAASFGQVLTETHLALDRATREVVRPASTSQNHLVVRTVRPDPAETAIIEFWKALSEPLAARVVGTLAPETDITGDSSTCRCEETPMADLVADAILDGTEAPEDGGAEVAFMNTGGVRASLRYDAINNGEAPGEITYAETYAVAPFNNVLVTVDLTGAQIEAILEQQFQPVDDRGSRPMLSLGVSDGFAYAWEWEGEAPAPNTQPDEDTTGGHVVPGSMTLDGVPIEADETYRVATLNFLADGGDLFTGFAAGENRLGGPEDLPNLVEYFESHPGLVPPPDRITGL